ncbi:MAG TPA: 3-hydroxyacyl-ACP dehydratase FabZ [Anaerolineales bacterium]|jgi:3-hydroxyacyl-[acyl-carrier-protein] dehydratase|nr:3-hydroxyacyl-ACP dehydratase FabZ [Anaerolineales bacterium]
MRFILIDRILELHPDESAIGVKNVTMSEDFLAHHFPHRPIMPGVLIVESMVQLADWLIRASSDFKMIGLATAFDRMKFRNVVRPGDQMKVKVSLTSQQGDLASFKGVAYVGDKLAASAHFTLIIEPIDTYISSEEAQKLFRMMSPVEEVV